MAIFALFLLSTVRELLPMPANVMDLLVCLFIRSSDKVENLLCFSLPQNEVDIISEINLS